MGKMSASNKAKAKRRAKSMPRRKDGRFKKGGGKLSGAKKKGAKKKAAKKSYSPKKKVSAKTAYKKKMRSLALKRPRYADGRFKKGGRMSGGLGKFRAASLLPREIDIGMIILGDALGISLATAAPKVIGVMVKPESANLAARITKIGLGIAGLAGYFAMKRSLTLGFAFGTMPSAVEAAANWIGDRLGTAIGEAKIKKGEQAAIPEKTPEPTPATEGGRRLGQLDPEQIRSLEMIAERSTGRRMGRYGQSSVRGMGDARYMGEEIAQAPVVEMPAGMGGSCLSSRW